MKLTLFKKASKVVNFTDFFPQEFLENTILMVSKIQTMRKLSNTTTTSFAGLSLTIVRFNLLE